MKKCSDQSLPVTEQLSSILAHLDNELAEVGMSLRNDAVYVALHVDRME